MINVAFCLPGEIYSVNFLRSWTNLLLKLDEYNVSPYLRWSVGSNVYKVRDECLGGDKTKGIDQSPFQGKYNYDYIMWIDSDQVFEPEDFKKLLDTLESKPDISILSGVYLKGNNRDYTSVVNNNHQDFKGKKAGFLNPDDLKGKRKLIEVEFTGMGFMMVRRGVFERIPYPWFAPINYSLGENEIVGFTNEDAAFCKRAKDAGFPTYIDPQLKIGHEKSLVLR